MHVKHLSLLNFRNYPKLELDFKAGKVLVLGRNGQGKTNLVEAIAYFDSLSSHRVSSDAPLFLQGNDTAVARLQVTHQNTSPTLELEFRSRQAKKAQINGNPVKLRELTRWFTAVLFAPEDLQIVRGEPSSRRTFLDGAIVTRNPYFAAVYKEYDRVLKQRTALLKSLRGAYKQPGVSETLEFWNQQLIDTGTRIMAERRLLVDQLQPRLEQAYQKLVAADHRPQLSLKESAATGAAQYLPVAENVSRETSPHLTPQSRENLTTEFIAQLRRSERKEFERGMTLVGPHRDDLEISLNALPVKGYASHGESWSVALGLKLAFADLLRDELAPEDPVLILDDVFAELDAARRARLMSSVADYQQVIVTAAVAEDIPTTTEWEIHVIRSGEVLQTGRSSDPAEFFADAIKNDEMRRKVIQHAVKQDQQSQLPLSQSEDDEEQQVRFEPILGERNAAE